MRQNNKNNRSRGRGGRKGPNPLTRSYESNGPDVKVRGTAQHVAEKYLTLARDALSAGDGVSAEAYFQHAEHYNRIIMAAQAQQNQMRDDDRRDDDRRDDDRRQGIASDSSQDHHAGDNGDQGDNGYDDEGATSYDQDDDPQPSIEDIQPVRQSDGGRDRDREKPVRDEEAASKPARRRPQQRSRRPVSADKATAMGRESAPKKTSDSIADNPPAFLVTD